MPLSRKFQRAQGGGGGAQRPEIPGRGPKAPARGFWLSKKWLAPLFRGFHSSLAPTARPGSYAGKPLLRKAFCGFAVHAAKSDESLKGPRSSIRQRFFDKLNPRAGAEGPRPGIFVCQARGPLALGRQTPPPPFGRTGVPQGRKPSPPHPGRISRPAESVFQEGPQPETQPFAHVPGPLASNLWEGSAAPPPPRRHPRQGSSRFPPAEAGAKAAGFRQ